MSSLQYLSEITVLDEERRNVSVTSLWQEGRIVLALVRHFG